LRRIEPTAGLVLDCCGKISHDLGLEERFAALFHTFSIRLKDRGITRILTACPGCTKIVRAYGNGFDVSGIYEILARAPLSPVPVPSASVAIHDPCPSRFDPNHQRAVRLLVRASGYGIRELPSHGNATRCCGQGGMVEGCVPGTVRKESGGIAAEAAGSPIVSSCGACCDTLSSVAPTAHVADVLAGIATFSTSPVPSPLRWLNRLRLRFARFP
jgi:Fe-S oxidoreductase